MSYLLTIFYVQVTNGHISTKTTYVPGLVQYVHSVSWPNFLLKIKFDVISLPHFVQVTTGHISTQIVCPNLIQDEVMVTIYPNVKDKFDVCHRCQDTELPTCKFSLEFGPICPSLGNFIGMHKEIIEIYYFRYLLDTKVAFGDNQGFCKFAQICYWWRHSMLNICF